MSERDRQTTIELLLEIGHAACRNIISVRPAPSPDWLLEQFDILDYADARLEAFGVPLSLRSW